MAEGVLGQIVAGKSEELARRFDSVSLGALRSRAVTTQRSLAAVLARDGARFILEIKKASPSAGEIRPNADPEVLARGYEGIADALSVLCDRLISAVRLTTSLPLVGVSTAPSSPRISSSIFARSPRPASPERMQSSSCCRYSTIKLHRA